MKIDYQTISDIITFDSEINTQNVAELIEKCQIKITTKPEQKILIYFSTIGGSFSHSELLLKYLNDNMDNIIMCAFHNVSSAGFYVFFNFKGEKDIVDHTFSIMHFGDRNTSWRDLSNEETFDFFMSSDMRLGMEASVLKLLSKLKISRKYIKMIQNGKDVFFNTENLRKFLANIS